MRLKLYVSFMLSTIECVVTVTLPLYVLVKVSVSLPSPRPAEKGRLLRFPEDPLRE